MVYAYDQWAQLPVKDIYDTQMMLAHVSQLKDMYEKAAQEMKDFKKEYGDFYSSRPEDMDWYRNEYGKIKNKMDQLYAQGLDLRSPEFRSEMARARDSFDIAAFNERKKSAANYDIYLQNKAKLDAAGKYNPQMEDAIIRSLGLNDPNKIWDRLSPSIYQDQIEITDNIFDKMEDDFIETKNGIDWYGVSRDRRTQALDAAIGDILNTPSGKFHYDQYKAAHPELNEADALAGFKNDLLNMSNKYEHRKGTENPDYKRKKDAAMDISVYRQKANIDINKAREIAKIKGDGDGISYGQSLFLRGIQNYSGSPDPGAAGLQSAIDFGNSLAGATAMQKTYAFKSHYMMHDAESPLMFYSRFSSIPSRIKETSANGINIDTAYDLNRIYSSDEITSNTLGWNGAVIRTDRAAIASNVQTRTSGGKNTEMHTTGNIYTAPMKTGSHEQFVEIKISGMQEPYYYLVTKSDPQPVEQTGYLINTPWNTTNSNTNPFAPFGYGITPSQESRNWWGATDNNMGKAAGLGQDQHKNTGGTYIEFQ